MEDRALELGFHLQPSWASGPNTTKNPLREALGVDRSQRDRKWTIFQTLPVDATAVWTLVGHVVADGFHFEKKTNEANGRMFLWIVQSLCEAAQKIWWDSMITRPGRNGVKLEGSGKVICHRQSFSSGAYAPAS